jgi:hypothetical protein
MGRCGIRLRYPVKIVIHHDDGIDVEGPVIGDAETLGQAIDLAENRGFLVREASQGGQSRLAPSGTDSSMGFLITVYPD